MPQVFINMDSRFLSELSESTALPTSTRMRLLQIAKNLQSMDERSTTAYARGFQEGKASSLARSNVEKKVGPTNLAAALELWKGEVAKLPPVEKKAHDNTLTLDDLDF